MRTDPVSPPHPQRAPRRRSWRAPLRRAAGLLLVLAAVASGGAAAQDSLSPERSVTLTLTKAMPLELPVDARDVLVANPEVADVVVKTPRLIYLIGLSVGDTNAFLLDAEGNQVMKLDIRVEMDLMALRSALARLVPEAEVQVDAINGDIVLSGEAPSAAVAEDVRRIARRFVEEDEDVVMMMRVAGSQQVVIQVRIAELRRDALKRLGVDLDFLDGDIGLVTALGAQEAAGALGVTAGSGAVDQFTAVIEALERDGVAKILAEPNLTAISGQSANFLAGGEFPVPVAGQDDESGFGIRIEFKPFGVGLGFTPVVLSSGRINLQISTEVSALSDQGAITLGDLVIPAVSVRRAQTTVEIPSGGSLVLAGLLRDDVVESIRGVPGLSDVPILGALFRSTEFERNETELVVIATPYLVEPVAPDQLTAPTEGFGAPTDLELFLLGRLFSRYAGPDSLPPSAPPGRVGFVLE